MVTLTPVLPQEKQILGNLLEKYEYEFSQWTLQDVDECGLYDYPYLGCYFTEPNRWAYFIHVDDKLAGFVLVNDYPEIPEHKTDFCLSEFFVMHKYRRNGVGRAAAMQVFARHHGTWQLKRHPRNIASVHFWNKVIDEASAGRFELIQSYPDHRVDYEDGTPADVFFFDNGPK